MPPLTLSAAACAQHATAAACAKRMTPACRPVRCTARLTVPNSFSVPPVRGVVVARTAGPGDDSTHQTLPEQVGCCKHPGVGWEGALNGTLGARRVCQEYAQLVQPAQVAPVAMYGRPMFKAQLEGFMISVAGAMQTKQAALPQGHPPPTAGPDQTTHMSIRT
jgi:hypothetical protein